MDEIKGIFLGIIIGVVFLSIISMAVSLDKIATDGITISVNPTIIEVTK